MANHKFGFYTGELVIDPYLSRKEIWTDCDTKVIEDTFRRAGGNRGGAYIIRRQAVEPYYRLKGIPEEIIQAKLKELGILSNDKKKELLQQVLSNDGAQLSLLDRISQA